MRQVRDHVAVDLLPIRKELDARQAVRAHVQPQHDVRPRERISPLSGAIVARVGGALEEDQAGEPCTDLQLPVHIRAPSLRRHSEQFAGPPAGGLIFGCPQPCAVSSCATKLLRRRLLPLPLLPGGLNGALAIEGFVHLMPTPTIGRQTEAQDPEIMSYNARRTPPAQKGARSSPALVYMYTFFASRRPSTCT